MDLVVVTSLVNGLVNDLFSLVDGLVDGLVSLVKDLVDGLVTLVDGQAVLAILLQKEAYMFKENSIWFMSSFLFLRHFGL